MGTDRSFNISRGVSIVIIRIGIASQVEMTLYNRCRSRVLTIYDQDIILAATVRVIEIMPGIIGIVITSEYIIISQAITVISIPFIQVTPAITIPNFHSEIAIVIVFVVVPVFVFFFFICFNKFLLWPGRRIINIVRGLTRLVCCGATSEQERGKSKE
jgi:hypothetical protein